MEEHKEELKVGRKEKITEFLQLSMVFIMLFGMVGALFYFGIKSDIERKESKTQVTYTGVVDKDLNLFIESYYESMNRYGIENTEKFSKDFFSEEYLESIDVKFVSEKLNLYEKAYGKNLKFDGEVLGIEHDEHGYYIGVLETIKQGDKVVEEYGGIYILEKIEDEFKIAYITGFYDEQSVGITVD